MNRFRDFIQNARLIRFFIPLLMLAFCAVFTAGLQPHFHADHEESSHDCGLCYLQHTALLETAPQPISLVICLILLLFLCSSVSRIHPFFALRLAADRSPPSAF